MKRKNIALFVSPFVLFSAIVISSCGSSIKQDKAISTNLNSSRSTSNYITITLKAGVGYFGDKKMNEKMVTVKRGSMYKNISSYMTAPSFDTGLVNKFNGWKYNGKLLTNTDEDIFSDNTILIADYKFNDITVTLDAKDGQFEDSSTTKSVTIAAYSKFKDVQAKVPNKEEPTKTNYIFSHYVDNDTNEIITPTTIMNKKAITLNACYVLAPSNPSFSNDSWETFLAYANKGLSFLKKIYKNDLIASGTFKGTFIGNTRTISIKNSETTSIDYTVKVIGEEVDKISEEGAGMAALTFEFENLITGNQAYDRLASGDPRSRSNINTYKGSSLDNYLNKFFSSFPDELKKTNGIKEVTKITNKGMGNNRGSGNNASDVHASKLFPLSATEYGLKAVGEAMENTFTYPSYSKVTISPSSRIKKFEYKDPDNPGSTISKALPYWMRSPDYNTNIACYSIADSGNLNKTPTDINNGLGVCPAFAVGQASTEITIKFNPDGGTWIDATGGSATKTIEFQTGYTFKDIKTLSSVPNVKKDNYTFIGWYDDAGKLYSDDTEISISVTLKAKYILTSKLVEVSFNGNGIYNFGGDLYSTNDEDYVTSIVPKLMNVDGENISLHSTPNDLSGFIIKTDGIDITNKDGVGFTSSGELIIPKKYLSKKLSIVCEAGLIANNVEDKIASIAKHDEQLSKVDPSKAGTYAKQFFRVGDIFNVIIDSNSYRTVLLDFGHSGDIYKDNNDYVISAMTFDFIDSVINYSVPFSNLDEANYLTSTLKNEVDSTLDKISKDAIKNAIKPIIHKTYNGISYSEFTSKMFVLSACEHTSQANLILAPQSEGNIYQYYTSSVASHIKYSGGMPCDYWLRTAYTNSDAQHHAYFISSDSMCSYTTDNMHKEWPKFIMPAFCI